MLLFPGLRAGQKARSHSAPSLQTAYSNITGLRITAHQFRHAAAALILQKHPGNYELVRLMLGHRNVANHDQVLHRA